MLVRQPGAVRGGGRIQRKPLTRGRLSLAQHPSTDASASGILTADGRTVRKLHGRYPEGSSDGSSES